MTPVQVDWLSVLLGPVVIVALLVAFFAGRSASKAGEPMPGWGKAVQGVAIALALFVAFMNMV
ncbi:hypothetical protein ACIREO_37290 [Streptomyces sp. NPDC102441]|uniref:hypothetical protein n=1 Tax=Streptomyces sp. NPDC102441 TaxID=3366176 RepID=UPI0037FA7CF8